MNMAGGCMHCHVSLISSTQLPVSVFFLIEVSSGTVKRKTRVEGESATQLKMQLKAKLLKERFASSRARAPLSQPAAPIECDQ